MRKGMGRSHMERSDRLSGVSHRVIFSDLLKKSVSCIKNLHHALKTNGHQAFIGILVERSVEGVTGPNQRLTCLMPLISCKKAWRNHAIRHSQQKSTTSGK